MQEIFAQKIHGATAIPYGRYEIAENFSERFQKVTPMLLEVKGYSGVRIHPGNNAEDTEGCLLPGTKKGTNQVMNSRLAYQALHKKISEALQKEKVFIQIVRA